ncbi:ClpP/crotonase-like domain-containing protein [Cantharellus anzutake]|uniref:ClpP/crotonase-like domain-containing protein n=1 Tax=Cantharellus anzutake TaxID=1750568 RepID=UPI001904F8CF|nr:ClpP/crotonase-like domain-containing protein [Cantharellus anzutake]KAF8338930.1 ClpP/crotonase-like domain-containing protein [Cantharellus anzutake]
MGPAFHRSLLLPMTSNYLCRPILPTSLKSLINSRWLTMQATKDDPSEGSAKPDAYLEQVSDGISAITLDRPKQKNAISVKLLSELKASIEQASEARGLRVLIIRSSERGSFCAGADLIERRTMSPAAVTLFLQTLRSTLTLLQDFRMPTIAAIDGPCLGGGLELALACDFRVAGSEAKKVGLTETKLGIIPGAGGTQRATRLLGITKAKELIFTGRMMDANAALAFGLVDYVADPSSTAFDRAMELAQEISTSAPLALRAAKMAISRADQVDLETGLDFEQACYAPLLRSKDRDEALEAFKEKRKPVFKGE